MKIDLTTTGARTGQRRTIELYAWEDGDRLVIVGSSGGSVRHPSWVHNLRATPRAHVTRGRETVEVTAREITEEPERSRLWDLVVEAFPLYGQYQARTKRLIPLFVLDTAAHDR
jgi:deazaflavin-dependent oxidoreductase (nitroreductase family)